VNILREGLRSNYEKLTQVIALSVGASLLLTQITDILTNQVKQQALVKSKES
jgi:hypothetical protein